MVPDLTSGIVPGTMSGALQPPLSVSCCAPWLWSTHSRRASDSAEWGRTHSRQCFFPYMILVQQAGYTVPCPGVIRKAKSKARRVLPCTLSGHRQTYQTGRFSASSMGSETGSLALLSCSPRTTSPGREPLPPIKPSRLPRCYLDGSLKLYRASEAASGDGFTHFVDWFVRHS